MNVLFIYDVFLTKSEMHHQNDKIVAAKRIFKNVNARLSGRALKKIFLNHINLTYCMFKYVSLNGF